MKRINGFIMLLACFACGTASAEISDSVVRVGVLNDISGLFQDTNGMGSVEAARMAAEDFDGGGKNIKVEIVYADHQNKADVGAVDAADQHWFDRDRFVLSNGHASMLLYSLLYLTGFKDMSLEELKRFRQIDITCGEKRITYTLPGYGIRLHADRAAAKSLKTKTD